MPNIFTLGDIVTLKSGGPDMTVVAVQPDLITCRWWIEVEPLPDARYACDFREQSFAPDTLHSEFVTALKHQSVVSEPFTLRPIRWYHRLLWRVFPSPARNTWGVPAQTQPECLSNVAPHADAHTVSALLAEQHPDERRYAPGVVYVTSEPDGKIICSGATQEEATAKFLALYPQATENQ